MRTETVTRNLYTFDELSEDAKQKAIDNNREMNVGDEWWECTYEDAHTIGLKITGFDLDRNRHATGEFTLSACEVAQNIFNNHGEQCTTFETAKEFMEDWQPVFDKYMETEDVELEPELIRLEDEFLQSLLGDYSIILQNECEYLQSDEAITERLSDGELFEFTEDGEDA